MKRYLTAILSVVVAYQKRFYRDKGALFFTLLFPLMFLAIFGSIYSSNTVSFKIAVINHSDTAFATQFVQSLGDESIFKVQPDITTLAAATQKMSRGEIDSIVELPSDFGASSQHGTPEGAVTVYNQKGSEQAGTTVAAVMQTVLDGINKQFGRPDAALKVATKTNTVSGATSFDYIFAGLLGFSIISMGVLGLGGSMPQEKRGGAFRRLRASPFRTSQLVLANGLHYLVVTLMSVLAMVLLGLGMFHFNMRGSWLVFAIYAVLSSVMVIGFGLAIGGWAKNENQASPLANLVAFPIMFLSGTFIPRFLFPEWLQNVTSYLPLAPVVDGFRRIMTENATLTSLGFELAVMAVWTIVIYFAAMKLFRWE